MVVVEHPVEVVDLVLDGLGKRALHLATILLAVPVARLECQAVGADDGAVVARQRKATLVDLLLVRRS